MKAQPLKPQPAIVSLAEAIVKVQQERAKASARRETILTELTKLDATLASCDKTQLEAQREMDRLAARL